MHFLRAGIINLVLNKICETMNIDKSVVIMENISYILSKWLIKEYRMAEFPWQMTISPTQSDFFYDYIQIITFNILSYSPNLLEDYVNLIPNETISTVIKVFYYF